MRDEEQKLKSWVRSLGDAGFLDAIDDGWSLPGRPSSPGAVITVDGAAEAPAAGEEPLAHRGRLPSMPEAGGGELPQTPVERSRPTPPWQPGSVPPEARRSRPAPAAPPRGKARRTIEGIPTPVPFPPVPGDSWAELAEVPPAPPGRAADRREPSPVRPERQSVQTGGHRITVPPAPVEEDLGGIGTIVEELPPETGARQQLRETVRPGRRGTAGGDGAAAHDVGQADRRMADLADLGDFSGALAAAEEILRVDPGHGEARRMRERCRGVLLQMYESRLGPLGRVPSLAVAEKELIWRDLDPVSGFVLSRVDGFSSFEDIIDISSLPRFETCRILDQLLQDGLLRVGR